MRCDIYPSSRQNLPQNVLNRNDQRDPLDTYQRKCIEAETVSHSKSTGLLQSALHDGVFRPLFWLSFMRWTSNISTLTWCLDNSSPQKPPLWWARDELNK